MANSAHCQFTQYIAHCKNRWRGSRDAARYGPSCIQEILPGGLPPWTTEYSASGPVDEDCLTLNIWTPSTTGEKRPVLVCIHGGGFTAGSGSVPVYRGATLAGQGIVVSINYRLGIYGFLAHPELTREARSDAPSNFGLQDRIAALRCIRQNIGKFGGDPAQVTIAGQSAGSMSVHMLVASPLAKGLFARAIAQSGLPTIPPIPTLAQAEQTGIVFARQKHAASLAQLRAMTPRRLKMPSASPFDPGLHFRSMIDGKLLPDSPANLMSRETFNDVPMMVGQTASKGPPSPVMGAQRHRTLHSDQRGVAR